MAEKSGADILVEAVFNRTRALFEGAHSADIEKSTAARARWCDA